jgi:hypothetical protein
VDNDAEHAVHISGQQSLYMGFMHPESHWQSLPFTYVPHPYFAQVPEDAAVVVVWPPPGIVDVVVVVVLTVVVAWPHNEGQTEHLSGQQSLLLGLVQAASQ